MIITRTWIRSTEKRRCGVVKNSPDMSLLMECRSHSLQAGNGELYVAENDVSVHYGQLRIP